ncbi:MAG TPA: cysteine peptidase family C39 domain-containing protein [Acidobacteriota bacterium]|nr:cysteine peptidase family C39 domain-containing protein [Acidobacteriota bacterium]
MMLSKGLLLGVLAGGALGSVVLLGTLIEDPQAFRRIRAWRMGARFEGLEQVVLQAGISDCGPAALCMVLRHHGLRVSLGELTRQAAPGPRGVRMGVLRSLAERHGLIAECRRLRPAQLSRVPLPAVVFFERGHFVVLEGISPEGTLEVLDPALGRLRFPPSAFERSWKGPILLIEPPSEPLLAMGRRTALAGGSQCRP